jgi:hypothetical protein
MKLKKFTELLKTDKYQVFLFTCPGNLPFSFASHPWFIINKKGVVSRWEILFRKTKHKTSWGHLHMNFFPLIRGIEIIPPFQRYLWQAKLRGFVEGDEYSMAKNMADFIENSKNIYPYREKFVLLGPNSNTYGQWVLDNFPEFKIKLPFNAIGKNYKK